LIIEPNTPLSEQEQLFEDASRWFFRLRADDVDTAEQEAFIDWLTANAEHAVAWDAVQNLFAELEAPAKQMRKLHPAETSVTCKTIKQPAKRRFYQSSAIVSLCLIVAIVITQTNLWQDWRADYHTASGEQRTVQLADGSHIQLNTDTALRVKFQDNERHIELLRGEAFFQVEHAPQRPFWVAAGDTLARVTGTGFSVNRSTTQVKISVAQGRVETSRRQHTDQVITLKPGQSAAYTNDQPAQIQNIDIQRQLAWQHGQLIFVQTPLAEVVAELNRYRAGRIIITDTHLQSRPITAVFNVDHLEDAIQALEKTLNLRVRRLSDYLLLLG
jgi:transmembrane sensor